jgi:hypothetical protein
MPCATLPPFDEESRVECSLHAYSGSGKQTQEPFTFTVAGRHTLGTGAKVASVDGGLALSIEGSHAACCSTSKLTPHNTRCGRSVHTSTITITGERIRGHTRASQSRSHRLRGDNSALTGRSRDNW